MRNISLVDNFRAPQDIGPHRSVYRSAAASSTCNAAAACVPGATLGTCTKGVPSTTTKREFGMSVQTHFSYYDQPGWSRFIHMGGWPNECAMPATGHTHPGQSPIDVPAAETLEAPSNAFIQLSAGFSLDRAALTVANNGHNMGISVCQTSAADCQATASFGTWPQTVRGADPASAVADEYYLLGFHMHWGSDGTKGSEHLICNQQRAAELHMVFANKRAVPADRNDPDSGTFLVVLGTLVEGGAAQDNPAYAPFLNNVVGLAKYQGQFGFLPEPIVLADLLPEDYATKFYTYPGSLTTPPCSQRVTWFLFENFVRVSDAQLDQLRQMQSHTSVRGHQYPGIFAMLFPITALALGSLTYQLQSRFAPWLPYTVTIMVEGGLLDWFAYLDKPTAEMDPRFPQFNMCPLPLLCNSMQRSLDMWADIDGHLLLFIFLPVLLFGDALNLDVHIFKKTFWQSFLLACPGVLFGALMSGITAYYVLPYNWSWNLSMAFGSILAATDPVAVVALLKSVGASDRLTMQIMGESLLNDGTAMVLFTLFFNMHMDWVDYTAAGIISFFVQMTIAAPLLGLAIGVVGYLWMRNASRRHNHADITIQTSVTVVVAFFAFYLAERECQISGVLSVITAGLVLARNVWPVVCSRDALESVWHALEYFGNTLIFFIAGVLTRRAIWADVITSRDFGWCIAMFLIMMVIRAVMVLLCYPVLTRIGYGTNIKDCMFMVWGGLRGAVGLALAVFVRTVLAGVDNDAGSQIFFMVAGLATLTLMVNATTSGPLLRASGMVGETPVKKQLLEQVHRRIRAHAEQQYSEICLSLNHDAVEAVESLGELEGLKGTESSTPAMVRAMSAQSNFVQTVSSIDVAEIIKDLEGKMAECGTKANESQVEILRESFMRIVRGKYWELVYEGKLPKTSPATLKLLNSVSAAMDNLKRPLHDWELLQPTVRIVDGGFVDHFLEAVDRILPDWVTWDNDLHYYLKVQREEEAYHATVSFIIAHTHAQGRLAEFYGDDPSPDSPEEITVILESARQVMQAKERLGWVSTMLIKIIKSSVITNMILENLKEFVHKLVVEGMLTESEAEGILHKMEHEQQAFHSVVKSKSRQIDTKSDILQDIRRTSLTSKSSNDEPSHVKSFDDKSASAVIPTEQTENVLVKSTSATSGSAVPGMVDDEPDITVLGA